MTITQSTNSQKAVSTTASKVATHQEQNLNLDAASAQQLANLCGQFDTHLKQIEDRLSVSLLHRGSQFSIRGNTDAVSAAVHILQSLYTDIRHGNEITPDNVHLTIQQFHHEHQDSENRVQIDSTIESLTVIRTKKGSV
ncbi:MAG: hypothetical protein ACRBCI_03175, partial [Cellvibrionaceae bacterium]